MKIISQKSCNVCGGSLNSIIDLPKLPLTGIFSEFVDPFFPAVDQRLMFCELCSHGQLLNILDPKVLYNENYSFRTSASETASSSSDFFVKYIKELFPNNRYKRVLEFGCSDGVLLNKLEEFSDNLLGIDPIWRDKQPEFESQKIKIIGDMVENIDLAKELNGLPDLVVSQHTIEHIDNPRQLLSQFYESTNDDTIFLIEFPCLDPLVHQIRFDHIFHQHLQYFSLESINKLLRSINYEIINYKFNDTYWGSLLVCFRKSQKRKSLNIIEEGKSYSKLNALTIQSAYSLFATQMRCTEQLLHSLDNNKIYGYGAALMLPILSYHLNSSLSNLVSIIDDDYRKAGLSYINLPVKISKREDVDFEQSIILLTALDNRRPILRRLYDLKPRLIINPLISI